MALGCTEPLSTCLQRLVTSLVREVLSHRGPRAPTVVWGAPEPKLGKETMGFLERRCSAVKSILISWQTVAFYVCYFVCTLREGRWMSLKSRPAVCGNDAEP